MFEIFPMKLKPPKEIVARVVQSI